MSNITNVQNGQPVMQNQEVQTANEAAAPAELQNARPNVGAIICRVLGAIFSLGLTEGVLAIANHIEAKAASRARGAAEALPEAEPSVTQRNAALSEQFKNDTLSPELKAAVSEAFSELRANYGEKLFPEGSSVHEIQAKSTEETGFREKSIINTVARAIRNSETELSPQDLKNCIIEKAGQRLTTAAAHAFILEQSPTISSNFAVSVLDVLSKAGAGFGEELAACKNAEEVKTCLLNQPDFTDTVEYFTGRSECEGKAIQHILDELAKVTGKSQQEIQSQLKLADVNAKFGFASDATKGMGTAQERLELLNTKVQDIAEKFIQTKTDLYTSIAPLKISEGLKELYRRDVLHEDTLKKGYVFTRAEQAANQVNVSSLVRVLQEGDDVSDLDLIGMIKSVSVQLSSAVDTLYSAEEATDLGGDGIGITMSTACQILLDKNPELAALLKQDPGKLDRIAEILYDQKLESNDRLGRENDTYSEADVLNAGSIVGSNYLLNTMQSLLQANSAVAESLNSDTMEDPFGAVMQNTLAEINAGYGVNVGANLKEASELPFGKDVVKNIANRITAQNQPLSSAQFADIIRSEFQTHVANLAVKTAISERCKELGLNTERLGSMLQSLKILYPALQESVNKSDSKEMIQAVLLSCDKYENILRRESDIHTYSTQIMKDAKARLAVLLGVDEAKVKETMNLYKLDDGFLILAKDIYDEGNASEDGSVPGIQERFQRIADRFVQGKSDLIALVNGNELAISPELKANWLNEINTNISLKNPVLLQGSYDVAQRMDGSGLVRALHARLSQPELLGLVKSLSAQIDEYAHQVFTQEQFNAMGSDETGYISQLARDAFWDKSAELKALLIENSATFKGINATLEDEFSTLVSRLSQLPTWTNASPESTQIRQEIAVVANARALLNDVFGNQE